MIDPGTAIGGGLAILASKDILLKILGPTADYVGGKTKGLVEKADINLNAIFSIALRKLGDRADAPGQVNPRVLKHVLDDGRFCEDEITREYFGGILASSKVEETADDRGVAIANILKGLSGYQIKLHYVIYELLRQQLLGENLFINATAVRRRVCFFIASPEYYETVAPDIDYNKERETIMAISAHVLHGLKRTFLIDEKTIDAKVGWIQELDAIFGNIMPNRFGK